MDTPETLTDAPMKVDLLSDDIHRHPLTDKILDIAAEKQIDLTNISAVATVLSNIDGADIADVRSLLLFSLVLERLINHDEMLSLQKVLEENISREDE